MAGLDDNRLVKVFAELRAAGKSTLIPFVTAGYPDMATTEALLRDFESRGVRVCELGVPFSDPIADGPTIQASYTQALAGGVTSEDILEMVRRYRGGGGELALGAMVSYSIVYRHGAGEFLSAAAGAGIDAFIVPDMPLDEASQFEALAGARGLANVMLIAPTTPQHRCLEIARHSRGFIYFISVAGITGARDHLPESTIEAVAELRKHTDTPVCVGFGISNAETVAHVCEVADGAIVGSAIVRRIAELGDSSTEDITAHVGAFVGELLSPLS